MGVAVTTTFRSTPDRNSVWILGEESPHLISKLEFDSFVINMIKGCPVQKIVF